ncbi:MAG: J domain-containing protein [bacterium]
MDNIECYRVLNLKENATWQEVKKAYRRSILMYHPDANPYDHQTTEKFKKIVCAYKTLEKITNETNMSPQTLYSRERNKKFNRITNYLKEAKDRFLIFNDKQRTINNKQQVFINKTNMPGFSPTQAINYSTQPSFSEELSFEAITMRLEHSNNKYVKREATRILVMSGLKARYYLVKSLDNISKENDIPSLTYIIDALGEYGNHSTCEILNRFLHHNDTKVVITTVRSISRIDQREKSCDFNYKQR